MVPKILFLHNRHPKVVEIIESKAPKGFTIVSVSQKASEEEQIAQVKDADFLLLHPGRMTPALWEVAKNLKLVQTMSAGVDNLDLKVAAQKGVPVANNGGANSWAVADHAMCLILALYRKLPQRQENTRTGQWKKGVEGLDTFELADKVLGIVGLGNIGKMVARRARAFEMKVQYYNRRRQPVEVEQELGVRYSSLDDLLQTSDVVSLHVPLNASTRGLIGERELGMMKKSAFLINTCRGPVVDEDALIAAVTDGRIAAGLDVMVKEPADPDNPLLHLDNVIVTPHCAGGTYDTWFRRADNCFANIVRVANGEPPLWVARDDES